MTRAMSAASDVTMSVIASATDQLVRVVGATEVDAAGAGRNRAGRATMNHGARRKDKQ